MIREIKFKALTFENKIIEVGKIEFFEDGTIVVNEKIPVKQLLQYTNLKDKNGREIFEGDIVRLIETVKIIYNLSEFEQINFIGKIEWDNEGADYNIIGKDEDDFRGLGNSNQEIEVLGNIYENPELLTQPEIDV